MAQNGCSLSPNGIAEVLTTKVAQWYRPGLLVCFPANDVQTSLNFVDTHWVNLGCQMKLKVNSLHVCFGNHVVRIQIQLNIWSTEWFEWSNYLFSYEPNLTFFIYKTFVPEEK